MIYTVCLSYPILSYTLADNPRISLEPCLKILILTEKFFLFLTRSPLLDFGHVPVFSTQADPRVEVVWPRFLPPFLNLGNTFDRDGRHAL